LLGFQLIAVLTKPFGELPAALKITHATGLGLMAISMVLLLAPAAYHRLACDGEATPSVHRVGSVLLTAASATLALGLAAEVMVGIGAIAGRVSVGASAAAFVLIVLLGLWYA